MKAGAWALHVRQAVEIAGAERIGHGVDVVAETNAGYGDLKTLSRASLEHAFLPGASLWRSPDGYRPARACATDRPGERDPRRRCKALLRNSAKAQTQWKLERAFRAFERQRRRAA